jgi:hypothetical protein
LPPRRVTEARLCRRAAEAWSRAAPHAPWDTTARAYVVRAGGLYFVIGWPPLRSGGLPTLVLNRKFQQITMIAYPD